MVKTFVHPTGAHSVLHEPVTLLVGLTRRELPVSVQNRVSSRVEELPFAFIHAVLARAADTREIVSPLFAEGFDATDLAYELDRADYTGSYLVVAPTIPQPDMVLRELREICPNVSVEFVVKMTH